MGLVTSALQIGKSALLAYQGGLQIVSNNIANVGSDQYARQSPRITPLSGTYRAGEYQGGSGVALTELRRHVDEALNARLRSANGDQQGALAEYGALTDMEALFDALSETDLSSQLSEFFNAWSDLQNTPEEQSTRSLVLTQGAALAESFRGIRQSLISQHEGIDDQLVQTVERVNAIATELADLNVQIVTAEAGGQNPGSTLRDQRDALLGELSGLVAIQTHEQPDGSMNVYIGNAPLVQHSLARQLTTTSEMVDGLQTESLAWADNGADVAVWGGTLEGLISARDTHIAGQLNGLNQLATALIGDLNRIHASGQGLEGYESVTGSYTLSDATVALSTADNGLGYLPENGGFLVTVTNATTGLQETVRIDVDLDDIGVDTTLTSLAADINGISNLTATVTSDNRLKLDAATGYTITFGEDSSGVLGALGVNTFFSGTDAATIAVDSTLAASPNRVAAATSDLPGDGSNAGQIAALASTASRSLNNGQSLQDYYSATMTELAVTTSAAKNAVDASDVITGSLRSQWESVSGVNLDEETLMLMRYQRAFQGAARIITVVDELIQQVLAMAR